LRALDEADVALGSRHVPGGGVEDWPLGRRLLSRLGSLYARTLLGLPASDVTSGFRAYRAEALRELDLDFLQARGFVFQIEILRRLLDLPGARAIEVPIVFHNRVAGTSKLSWQVIAEATGEVARLVVRRRALPRRRYDALDEIESCEPQVSVIVAQRPGAGEPESVRGLHRLEYPAGRIEVIVARGECPSRQRNEAASVSSGDFLLFLDDDSVPSPGLLQTYVQAFRRDATLGAVGGPAEATGEPGFPHLAALVLGEPWVMGKSAARYRSLGQARFTDERELILCNLCVRRSVFEAAGGFNEALYPNEENEFLERLGRRGARLLYRPDAVVRRPQRRSAPELLQSVYRYGRGRAEQLKVLPSRSSLGRAGLGLTLLAALTLSALALPLGSPGCALPAILYALYLAALSLRLARRGGLKAGLAGAGLSALVHSSYALGLLVGLVSRKPERAGREVALERRDPFPETRRVA
jgi:GT2 family glycosyltransferase